MKLPEEFVRRLGGFFGQSGIRWAATFPRTYSECIARWGLTDVVVHENLSVNFVAYARAADGTPVVLKAGAPNPELNSEIEALRIAGGRGYVRMLDVAPDLGAMLLERVLPGTPLADVQDDVEATEIAVRVLKTSVMQPPPDHKLQMVTAWADGLKKVRPFFDGGTGPLPGEYVDRAISLFARLFAQDHDQVVVHGDYHHWNVLRSDRTEWMIIDPKGLAGPLGFEIGQFIHNFPESALQQADMATLVRRRIDIFSRVLGIPDTELLEWAFSQTILSAWWSVEDSGEFCQTLDCADTLYSMLP